MMIKYRVHDVAKDLDVPNKEVLDILGKYVKEPKKHMTALEENELDIVFDRFTQDHAAQNFDAYFATRNAAKTEEKPFSKAVPFCASSRFSWKRLKRSASETPV